MMNKVNSATYLPSSSFVGKSKTWVQVSPSEAYESNSKGVAVTSIHLLSRGISSWNSLVYQGSMAMTALR